MSYPYSLKPFNDNILLDESELINWSVAVKTIILNDNVINANSSKLNWNDLIRYQKLSENIIEKYFNAFTFDDIIRYQKVSVEFLNKNMNRISVYTMKLILLYQTLPYMWIINRLNDVNHYPKLFKELFEIVVKHNKIDEDTLAAYVVALTEEDKKNPGNGTNLLNLRNIKDILVEAETKKVKDEFNQRYMGVGNMGVAISNNISNTSISNNISNTNITNNISNTSIGNNDLSYYDVEVPEKWIKPKNDKPPIDMMLVTTAFSSGDAEIKKLIKRYVESEFDTSKNPNNLITDPDVHTTICEWMDDSVWNDINHYNLSEDFIARYYKRLNLSSIFRSNVYDETLWFKLEKAGCKLTPLEAYSFMNGIGDISPEFGISHLKYAKWWDYYDKLPDLENFDYEDFVKRTKWGVLVVKNKLPEWFMSYFADKLDWWKVPRHQRNLSMDFIKAHIGKIDLEQTCIYQTLSIEFLREYKEFLPWETLSLWQPFTPEMLVEFANLITDDIKRNKHFATGQKNTEQKDVKLSLDEKERNELTALMYDDKRTSDHNNIGEFLSVFENCDADINTTDSIVEDFLAEERKKLEHQKNIDNL